MRKPAFCICKNKGYIDRAIMDLVLDLLHKPIITSHILWLYSPICVGTCRKPQRQDFSRYRFLKSCNSNLQRGVVALREKTGFPTRLDTNWAVQPQKMFRAFEFWIKNVAELCLCFCIYARSRLFQDTAHFIVIQINPETFTRVVPVKRGLLL